MMSCSRLGPQVLDDVHAFSEITPRPIAATWISGSRFAYFRYNPYLQLTDLVIRDTNLAKLDSFSITTYADLNYGSIFHIPGTFILAGYSGVLRLDSITHIVHQVDSSEVQWSDVSQNGSFIVFTVLNGSNPSPLMAMNLTTNAKIKLAPSVHYLALSPTGDHLAYIDNSDPKNEVLKVIPVSAP